MRLIFGVTLGILASMINGGLSTFEFMVISMLFWIGLTVNDIYEDLKDKN